MRTNKEPTFVETSNVGEVRQATIKASAKLFNFFSEQIYSDKYVAIWRELVANAVDAQKVKGETRPPIVTVPSMLEPYAKVRDFGTGMGHDFMMNKFMAFTDASTKENSDDFIGGFGIGSKAPLAYTEQFSIKSYQNGVVKVYSVFKDSTGCPSIAFLSEAQTSEPDGVEVGFPVRQDDVHAFSDVVVNTLQYFNPLPVLENTELKLEPVKYEVRGWRWGLRFNVRESKVIVGGVAYPLNYSAIPYSRAKLRDVAQSGMDFYLDIGDVNIALSRESITHDEKLFDKLDNFIVGMDAEVDRQLSDMFAKCQTKWEAKDVLRGALESVSHQQQSLIKKHAKWQGERLNLMIARPSEPEFETVLVIAYGDVNTYSVRASGYTWTTANSPKYRAWMPTSWFSTKAFNRIVIDDAPDKSIARIRTLTLKYPDERILFLKDNSEKRNINMSNLLKALGSPPAGMVDYLSKYDPTKLARGPSTGSVTRPFKCYSINRVPHRGMTELSAIPSGGGIYVRMDNFYPLDADRLIEISKLTLKDGQQLLWLNKTDFESSKIEDHKDWISVDEAAELAKKDYRKNHKDLPMAEAMSMLIGSATLFHYVDALKTIKTCPKSGPLRRLINLHEKFKPMMTPQHRMMRQELGINGDLNLTKLKALLKEVNEKYPTLMKVLGDTYLLHRMPETLKNHIFC